MTSLLIATLLTQEPTLLTSDELRVRLAGLSDRREALGVRRDALPWLRGGGAIATTLAGAGLIYCVASLAESGQQHALPIEGALAVTGANLFGAVTLHLLVWLIERKLDIEGPRVERDAASLRALYSAL